MPEIEAAVRVRLVVVERAVGAGLVAARLLDPDDIGAEAGQHLAAIFAKLASDFDDPEAAQELAEFLRAFTTLAFRNHSKLLSACNLRRLAWQLPWLNPSQREPLHPLGICTSVT
jgi:hypothetical protein